MKKIAICLIIVLTVIPVLCQNKRDYYEVRFSPRGEIEKHIIKNIRDAHDEIDIAIYMLTSNNISAALVKAIHKGVKVRIVFDGNNANEVRQSKDKKLKKEGASVRYIKTKPNKRTGFAPAFHHKFAVIDKQIVITGSYNWTLSAELYNYEDSLIFCNKDIAKDYMNRFEFLFKKGKKTNRK